MPSKFAKGNTKAKFTGRMCGIIKINQTKPRQAGAISKEIKTRSQRKEKGRSEDEGELQKNAGAEVPVQRAKNYLQSAQHPRNID